MTVIPKDLFLTRSLKTFISLHCKLCSGFVACHFQQYGGFLKHAEI